MDLCPDLTHEKESNFMVVVISKEACPLPLEEKFRQWGITTFTDVTVSGGKCITRFPPISSAAKGTNLGLWVHVASVRGRKGKTSCSNKVYKYL